MHTKIHGTMTRGSAAWPATAALAAITALAVVASGCKSSPAPAIPSTGTGEQAGAYPGAQDTPRPATAEEAYPGAERAASGDRLALLAGEAGVQSLETIEDWADYSSADQVEEATDRNLGLGDNRMDLTLAASDGQGLPPGNVLEVAYDISAAAPDDFVGFNRALPAGANWTGATAIGLWVAADTAPGVDVVIQFRESSGEMWRARAPASAAAANPPLLLALDTTTFQRPAWSAAENGQIDLGAIDQYGLYVGHQGPGKSGALRFGPIVLIR